MGIGRKQIFKINVNKEKKHNQRNSEKKKATKDRNYRNDDHLFFPPPLKTLCRKIEVEE